jgi:hypothetical protein
VISIYGCSLPLWRQAVIRRRDRIDKYLLDTMSPLHITLLFLLPCSSSAGQAINIASAWQYQQHVSACSARYRTEVAIVGYDGSGEQRHDIALALCLRIATLHAAPQAPDAEAHEDAAGRNRATFCYSTFLDTYRQPHQSPARLPAKRIGGC